MVVILILTTISFNLNGQRNFDFSEELILKIEIVFDSRLISEYSNYQTYEFTINSENSIPIYGKKVVLQFENNIKSKKIFKEIDRAERIRLFENYLNENYFEKIYSSKDLKISTFNRNSISLEEDFIEIYYPNKLKENIEIQIVYQYSLEEKLFKKPIFNEKIANSISFDCTERALIPDVYSKISKEYYEYSGMSNNANDVEEFKILISEGYSKWTKTKADKNCLSSNPEDCLVWTLLEFPATFKTINLVTDLSTQNDLKLTKEDSYVLTRKGGFTENVACVCEDDITEDVLEELQRVLKEHGFYNEGFKDSFDSELKLALRNYQRVNNLPIGCLDEETISKL